MLIEEPLMGGNAIGSVVRVGSTVRKRWTRVSGDVHSYMSAVRDAGVDVPGVPGRDALGRQILGYVPGQRAIDAGPLTLAGLSRVGRLVRAIHDASASFRAPADTPWEVAIAAPREDLMCHNDLAPWNLLIGRRWIFIDWDGAGPSTRLWDLAYAAQAFTLNDVSLTPDAAAQRLAVFVDGYAAPRGLRESLPTAMADRTAAMLDLL